MQQFSGEFKTMDILCKAAANDSINNWEAFFAVFESYHMFSDVKFT